MYHYQQEGLIVDQFFLRQEKRKQEQAMPAFVNVVPGIASIKFV